MANRLIRAYTNDGKILLGRNQIQLTGIGSRYPTNIYRNTNSINTQTARSPIRTPSTSLTFSQSKLRLNTR